MTISTTLHEVQAIPASPPTSLGHVVDRMSYYRVLKVRTEAGEVFELTLFSPDQEALDILEEY